MRKIRSAFWRMAVLCLALLPSCARDLSNTARVPVPTAALTKPVGLTESSTDPFVYCASVGQIDTQDARYTGPTMSDALFKAYLAAAGLDTSIDYPASFRQMTVWRCMGGHVYACNFGANIPCDAKADTSKTPTQAMNDYCAQYPGSTFIPMSVTGHSTIYSWHCNSTAAELLGPFDTVDAAGYQTRYWVLLSE